MHAGSLQDDSTVGVKPCPGAQGAPGSVPDVQELSHRNVEGRVGLRGHFLQKEGSAPVLCLPTGSLQHSDTRGYVVGAR